MDFTKHVVDHGPRIRASRRIEELGLGSSKTAPKADKPEEGGDLTALIKSYRSHKAKWEEFEEAVTKTMEWKTTTATAKKFKKEETLKLETEALRHKTAMTKAQDEILALTGPDLGVVADFLVELAADRAAGRTELWAATRVTQGARDDDYNTDDVERRIREIDLVHEDHEPSQGFDLHKFEQFMMTGAVHIKDNRQVGDISPRSGIFAKPHSTGGNSQAGT